MSGAYVCVWTEYVDYSWPLCWIRIYNIRKWPNTAVYLMKRWYPKAPYFCQLARLHSMYSDGKCCRSKRPYHQESIDRNRTYSPWRLDKSLSIMEFKVDSPYKKNPAVLLNHNHPVTSHSLLIRRALRLSIIVILTSDHHRFLDVVLSTPTALV